MTAKRRLVVGAVAAAVCVGAYRTWLRPWQERWGATDDEVTAALPGDALLPDPDAQVTRAITVDAPPESIWPWIVQLGADRAGFYSYDWLENVFGLRIHSADEIVAEWQALRVGDIVAADRARRGGWLVVDLRPNEAMVLQVADVATGRPLRRSEALRWEFQWTFAIRPVGTQRSRLLVRERVAFASALTKWLMAPVGVVSFVMTRRMLLGVKERAERGTAKPDLIIPH